MSRDAASIPHEKEKLEKETDTQQDLSPFSAYTRLFSYTTLPEWILSALALAAALASGVALALVNLVFGGLITTLSDFVGGQSSPESFRSEVSKSA